MATNGWWLLALVVVVVLVLTCDRESLLSLAADVCRVLPAAAVLGLSGAIRLWDWRMRSIVKSVRDSSAAISHLTVANPLPFPDAAPGHSASEHGGIKVPMGGGWIVIGWQRR